MDGFPSGMGGAPVGAAGAGGAEGVGALVTGVLWLVAAAGAVEPVVSACW
ncbi:MAG: hypothetical protein U5N53_33070 [Mycobacterium sp.]|nr:hypothetical protein [Mycobacterium sp.]